MKGALARRPFEFTTPSGVACKVDLVPLLGRREAMVLESARAFAVKHGVAEPKEGDPLYEMGIWVHTIALGVVDPDSPENDPKPFFDGGVDQILDERHGLGREWIALLFEAQQAWQDELAPRPKEMGAVEFYNHLLQIVEAPPRVELPFFRWRRVLQDSFLRTLAGLLLKPPTDKSSPGAFSTAAPMSSTNSAPPPTNEKSVLEATPPNEPPKDEA